MPASPTLPVARVHAGSDSPAELERRLKEAERRLEDLQDKRVVLTRWCFLFTKSVYRLEDQAELSAAATQTHDDAPVFALQAWAPRKSMRDLKEYARDAVLAIEAEKPGRDEEPPTLLANKRTAASGQDLVSFYSTPGYWLWDPSAIVFYAFAIFFAMIVSDAAYGTVFGLILALLWRKMGRSDGGKRFRLLCTVLVLATIVYGILVGSYFGISPPPHSFLGRLKILDVEDYGTMMTVSIMIGVAHLIIANIGDFWSKRWTLGMFSSLGWVCMFGGGTIFWQHFAGGLGEPKWRSIGIGAAISGLALIILFTKTTGPIWKRLLGGLQALTRLSGAFGDTLSYLRLFALGLASASLATTFNGLGAQVGEAVPGVGFLLSILIILLGHALNLILALASGVIHGLRLNFIEFFNWSMPEEGRPFKAFAKKEAAIKTPS
jgi:V/A-type H+-transporting ATPase subunit I